MKNQPNKYVVVRSDLSNIVAFTSFLTEDWEAHRDDNETAIGYYRTRKEADANTPRWYLKEHAKTQNPVCRAALR